MFGTKGVEIAIGQINGYIKPTKAERQAAYELFIELSSRATTVNDSEDKRSIAEILSDIAEMSETTRNILRENGVDSAKDRKDGNVTLAIVALRVHNEILGPRVNKWTPLLNEAKTAATKADPDIDTETLSWERTCWDGFPICRSELESMRDEVRSYMDTLARIAGSPGLSDLVVPVPPAAPITPVVTTDRPTDRAGWTRGALPRYAMYRWFDPIGGLLTLVSHLRSGSHDRSFNREQVAQLRNVDGWFKRRKRRKLRKQFAEPKGSGAKRQLGEFATIDLGHDETKELWFDYVSDLGDGIDPTLAVAWQLTRPSVTLPIDRSGELPEPPPELPRGQLLVMGGDQVYPYASANRYRDQLVMPYQLAAQSQPQSNGDQNASEEPARKIVAIPGNHDWLGGIEAFEDIFIGKTNDKESNEDKAAGPTMFAGWEAPQKERWWAIKLRKGWWIWGIDTGLDDTLDPIQVDHFTTAAKELEAGDQVIICSPVPLWQLRQKRQEKYFDIRATLTALIESKNADTPLFLAGDSHFFAHYRRVDGVADEHHITAGGGGAFLQPTHNLPQQIPLERGAPDFKLGARWPRPLDSRSLGANLGGLSDKQFRGVFAIVGGVHAAFAALVSIRLGSLGADETGTESNVDGALDSLKWVLGAWTGWPLLVLMILGMIKATAPNSKESQLRTGAVRYGAMLGLAQAAAFAAVASIARWNGPIPDNRWLRYLVLPMIGGVISTALFVALVRWINRTIKASDTVAFSSAHLTRYKHFLRMRISPNGDLQVYCVGLDPVGKSWYYAVTGDPVLSTWKKAMQRVFGISPRDAEAQVRKVAKRLAKRQQFWGGLLSKFVPKNFFFDTSLAASQDRDRLIPPFDPAGVPKLHYVWGKQFPAASDELLQERERILGKNHPKTTTTRDKVVVELREQGHFDLALARAKANVDSAHANDAPDQLRVYQLRLAETHLEAGEPTKAIKVLEPLRSRGLDEEGASDGASTITAWMARAYNDAGLPQKTLELLAYNLDGQQVEGPAAAELSGLCTYELARALDLYSQPKDAGSTIAEALLRLEAEGAPRAHILSAMALEAKLAAGQHPSEEDLRELEQLLEECERHFRNPTHRVVITARSALAALTIAAAIDAESYEHIERAGELLERNVEVLGGLTTKSTARGTALVAALEDLVEFELRFRSNSAAIDQQQKIIEELARIYGQRHEKSIRARNYLTSVFSQVGGQEQACRTARETLRLAESGEKALDQAVLFDCQLALIRAISVLTADEAPDDATRNEAKDLLKKLSRSPSANVMRQEILVFRSQFVEDADFTQEWLFMLEDEYDQLTGDPSECGRKWNLGLEIISSWLSEESVPTDYVTDELVTHVMDPSSSLDHPRDQAQMLVAKGLLAISEDADTDEVSVDCLDRATKLLESAARLQTTPTDDASFHDDGGSDESDYTIEQLKHMVEIQRRRMSLATEAESARVPLSTVIHGYRELIAEQLELYGARFEVLGDVWSLATLHSEAGEADAASQQLTDLLDKVERHDQVDETLSVRLMLAIAQLSRNDHHRSIAMYERVLKTLDEHDEYQDEVGPRGHYQTLFERLSDLSIGVTPDDEQVSDIIDVKRLLARSYLDAGRIVDAKALGDEIVDTAARDFHTTDPRRVRVTELAEDIAAAEGRRNESRSDSDLMDLRG